MGWMLAALIVAGVSATWGYLVDRNHLFPYSVLRRAHDVLAPPPTPLPRNFYLRRRGEALSPDAVDRLARLPYLEGYRPATERGGVSVYDRALAEDGWNLLTSANAPVATLMDMDGTVRKTWTADARESFPGLTISDDDKDRDKFLRCARLTEDGGIVAMFDLIGLVRLDASSQVVWAYRRKVHHDILLEPGGGIWVLSRETRPGSDLGRNGEVWEDFVERLSPDGRPDRKISLLDALRRSSYAPLLARAPAGMDMLHTNSMQILDGSFADRLPAFRRGNILLSMRNLSALAVLDPEAGQIVWALSGQWRSQHSAWLLPSGRLLLFDNLGTMRAASRVLEVDPFTQEIHWSYGGRPGEELLSEINGLVRRLSGGNTLIVESNYGRALEVTPDHRVVWEFVNPTRAGIAKELVATLYQLERVPRDRLFLEGSGQSDHPAELPR